MVNVYIGLSILPVLYAGQGNDRLAIIDNFSYLIKITMVGSWWMYTYVSLYCLSCIQDKVESGFVGLAIIDNFS